MDILAATGNSGKVKEIKEFMANLPLRVRNLNEFTNITDVAETGVTFTENAVLKAKEYALQTGIWALADDSGLEVAALNGEPGVYSARYAGENSTNEEKIDKLLKALDETGDEQRQARFVCVMAVSDEQGNIKFVAEGICDGRIAHTPGGINGFGYDPVFIPQDFSRTFGELSGEIKGKISHRARAIEKIIQFLRSFIVPQLDRSVFRL